MTNKWKQVSHDKLFNMYLCKSYSDIGKDSWEKMLNAKVETFAHEMYTDPTNIHFYTTSIEKAREWYLKVKEFLPDSIKEFSLDEN